MKPSSIMKISIERHIRRNIGVGVKIPRRPVREAEICRREEKRRREMKKKSLFVLK